VNEGEGLNETSYLRWFVTRAGARWWNDSANTAELRRAKEFGASGVTTNPLLVQAAVEAGKNDWANEARTVAASGLNPAERAEAISSLVAVRTAPLFMPEYRASDGTDGYVCAQVNPSLFGDRDAMHAMATRYAAVSPNIAVKLPACEAGLDVLEDCIAEGITVTATVSFTVPQVIAIAERHRRGILRAQEDNRRPGRCFAVIMIGRVDDYLRDLARDHGCGLDDDDLNWAGLAIVKRAYGIYVERKYPTRLLVAAMRGSNHITELAGAAVTMSVHPKHQEPLFTAALPKEDRIEHPIPTTVVDRLYRIRDFVRAYEPDGLRPREFASFGLFQRTITQFHESGWRLLERRPGT
jgi:transaldolase